MKGYRKLNTEDSALIVKRLGGAQKVAEILDNNVTRQAVYHWKRRGMPIFIADSLKLRFPYSDIWNMVNWSNESEGAN